MNRHGDWMQTYTGRQFWPVDPLPEEVCIEDIAHALSLCCRYGGHVKRFYSVAEHCVLMARVAPPAIRKVALMHDASEAYLVDIPRPLKSSLVGYAEIEARLMWVIAGKFQFDWPMPPDIKRLDNRILIDERDQLMAEPPADWCLDEAEGLGVECAGWEPGLAEALFLREFREVMR